MAFSGRLFAHGEHVIVAVSGGADSTALALLLSPFRSERSGNLHITLAHFDHCLRSKREAEEDQAYVQRLADRLGVELLQSSGDVRDRVRTLGQSVEEAARDLRYRFLRAAAEDAGATLVAVGHTRSDQSETVLHRIIRGTGLDGLAAMRPKACWPFGEGPDVIRPLLCLWQAETEEYCRLAGFSPRTDPSNSDLSFTRNRLRHEILPALRRLNPKVDEALARLATIAQADVDHLDKQVTQAWATITEKETPEAVLFSRVALLNLDRPVAVTALRRAVRMLSRRGEIALPAHQVERLFNNLEGQKMSWRGDLGGGIRAVIAKRTTGVYRATEGTSATLMPATTLVVPGVTELAGWRFEVSEVAAPRRRRIGTLLALLDEGALRGGLVVRSRWAGDRLRPLGLGGWKKVQDVLVDAKVAAAERDGVPLVCDEAGVVWVVGHCIDDRVALGLGSTRVVRIQASRVD